MQRFAALGVSGVRGRLPVALIATLVACGGGTGAQVTPGSSVSTARQACCAKVKTLFVTDASGGSSYTGAVFEFNYETAELIGQVAAPPEGWLDVQGACVNNKGDVYLANTKKSTIDEYTHAAVFVRALQDPGESPVDCAYDALSGNLAVANVFSVGGGPGSISIYHDHSLKRTLYPPNMSRVYSVGYQRGTSTLWLDGTNSSDFFIDTLSNGTFAKLKIRGLLDNGIDFGLQWSATTHAMNAAGTVESGSVIWHISPKGRITGETPIACGSAFCQGAAFFIEGPRVAVVNLGYLEVELLRYPAGGVPIMTYKAAFHYPVDLVVTGP